eukprot:CAMPEP_0176259152 /NCGR_PEP_ID=MMETSP0121_2-20121125/38928_1 /TAXON_ID=160619 /ORGANISM="Kryptoperidinium foliaceum, Strain CCMP 1326" /LENGTH=122 /DNA_ID=CAMNT_0017599039 /DNA_START=119 /DNA_END=484 /DNA_ORIENTATION=+
MGDRRDGNKHLPDIRRMCSLKVDISGQPPSRWNPEDLKEVFSKYGEVGDVFIPRPKNSSRQSGFAFVRFHSERDGSEALRKMNGYDLDGCRLSVSRAQYGRGEKPHDGGQGRDAPRRRSRSR